MKSVFVYDAYQPVEGEYMMTCCRHEDEYECSSCKAVRLKEERRLVKVEMRKNKRNGVKTPKIMATFFQFRDVEKTIENGEAKLAAEIQSKFSDNSGPIFEGERRRFNLV